MRKILSFSFLTPLLAAAFLAGCGPAYYPGDSRYPDDRRYPDGAYGQSGQFDDVSGTVASVNPRARLIYIDREGYGYGDRDLRNGDGRGDTLVLSYDDGTTVRYQGRTFRPEDLERGDRIQVSVDRNDGGRLFAESIDVVYDVSQGGPGPQGGYGTYGGYDDRDNRNDDLRGIIRSIDTRSRTLEIDRSSYNDSFAPDRDRYGDRSDNTIRVSYDPNTPVRFQGSVYNPDNLERGDEVRIRVHDYDGRLFAQEIVVVRDRRSGL